MKKLLITLVLLTISIPVWGASTRQNRGDSLIFVGISPVGLHIPTLVTMPVGLGVYLGKNFLIGAETGNVTFDTDSDGSDGDSSAEGSYNNSGIYARWFPGTNSFNLGLALHKRIFSATATASSFDPTYGVVDVEASLDADATVGSVILGNQWMMDFGLVLAMDWIIVSGLIDSKVDSSFSGRVVTSSGQVISIEELDPETVADAERELNSIGEDINTISAFPGILVFTIGWAF